MLNPPLVGNILEGINSGKKTSILGGLSPYAQETTLDDSTVRRRSMVHTVANLNSIPMDPNASILQGAYDNIKTMGDIIRVAGDRGLREQESLKLLEETVSPLALNIAMSDTDKATRDASYQMMNQKYAEAAQGREDMATERRYVEKLQGLLETGKFAEAKMIETLYNTPDAYSWTYQRQSDMAHMMKLLEDEMPEEKDRLWVFGLTDMLMLTLPFLETTAYSDNVDTVNVEKGGMDWLLPGQRLRNEAYAFGQILNIRDPIKRAEAMKQVAKNMAASANDFGYRNQMMEGLIKSAVLTKPPNADETNAWAAFDALLSPLVAFDVLDALRGARFLKNTAVKSFKRAGLRNDAANIVKDAAERIKTKGAGATVDETGVTLDDVEEAYSPAALNPTATPGDTSLAGQLVDGPEDAETVARKLFGDNLKVERLTEEEWAEANLRVKAQTKKDFGRHVHDVQFDEIKLMTGTTVRSPVVVLGTTKDSLFVSKTAAEDAMATMGLDSAVVREIPSDNGVLYGVEARLPISESQFYRKISDTKPKNFIWRFLLGSRQTSSDDLYGLGELVVAKRQKIITALEKDVNPLFNKLNNDNKQKLLDILVRSEKDQKWFTTKELDVLWARQMGIGDDVHEITDTSISLGNIPAPGGAAVDPDFLRQKGFAELKDEAEVVGRQLDDTFKGAKGQDETTFWENIEGPQERIEKSGSGGTFIQYATYDDLLAEARAAVPLATEDDVAKQLGVTRETFEAQRLKELPDYVEGPVQPLVKDIWAKGGRPMMSNAYGPGDKGVWWIDNNGVEQFTPLSYDPAEVKNLVLKRQELAAKIAKGPGGIEIPTIDAFLEPHTYKAQRANSPTPPVQPGMVRMYHGGVPGEGGRWATSSLEDARGWAARGEGMNIQYVDIPADDTRIFAPGEGAAEGFAPNGRFELTAEEMATARPFKEAGQQGKRIEESAGKGVVLQYPTYAAFIKEAKKVGMSEAEIQNITGVTPETFEAMREAELQKYVEGPAQQTVRDIWAEGGFPYSSNAFGPGQKGVAYADVGGRNKHRELPEQPAPAANIFPPEHEDLWRALDAAADEVLANQAKAGEQATRSMKRAANLSMVDEIRQDTSWLDDFVELFRGGAIGSEISKIEGMPSTPFYGFASRADINTLAEQVAPMDPRWGTRTNGIRLLELPGGRFVAWPGHMDFHDNVFNQINDMLDERGLPLLKMEDTTNVFIPVDPSKTGAKRFGKVELARSSNGGVWDDVSQMGYGDFMRQLDTYTAAGPAFTKRAKDAERKANKAMESAMTGGSVTEDFRAMVDKAMTMTSTKYLRNADGQVLHTNREKIMSRPMEWSEQMAGLMPQKIKQAYYKLVELSNVEHLLRNEDAYLQRAVRGFQTIKFRGAEDVNGIVYRAGSIPPVPSTRVYNISDDTHYVAKTDDEVKVGQSLRLTPADITRMMKKEGYIMVRLEGTIEVGNRVTVQWFIGKAADFEVKPLKFEQIGYVAGGHRGYQDKHFAKQASTGKQGDNGELYLKSPSTFIVGTQAEVAEWTRVMEQARIIWNNTDDEARRMELLARHLDSKPGYPGAEEFAGMVAKGEFDPEYPVEALYDREMPSDYAKLKQRGWDDLSDPEESGINSYMQTHGRMYTSPKGTRLPDWRGQDATIIDPYEMMNKALNNIAALSSLTDYKLRSIEKWVTTFGPYLDLRGIPRDASPVRIFQESVFLSDLPEAQKLKNSAEAQRDTIKRILGWRSDIDREFEYLGRQLVSVVAGDKPGKWNKTMSRGVEWALEKNPVARARKMAFHMKLGLFNVAQFPMQISTMMAAMSLDVRAGAQAFGGFPAMRGAIGLRGQALDDWASLAIERGFHTLSGFDDVVEFREMLKTAAGSGWFDIGGSHSLVNYHGVDASMGAIGKGAIGEVLDASGKVLREVGQKGTFFFNEAELWNRMIAWQMAWKHVRKNGLVPGTSKFNEGLMTRANDMSINMSVAGSAAWQKGWASVPTQFLSYQARFLEALLGKQFTTTEKLRLLLGQGVLYGTAGIPFLAFASEMMRSGEGEAPEIGTWEGLVDRGIIDTMIFAATSVVGAPTDVLYGERAATGAFITDMFRELFGMSKYGEVSFVDIMGGPLWGITKETSKTFWDVVKSVAAESGGDTGLPLTSASVIDFAKNISSFNNAYKAYMVWNYGQYVTKTGKIALDDLPSTDAFAVFLGLAPGEYRDYVAKQDWRRNRGETVKEVSDKIVEYRQRLVREVDNADAIISEQELLRAMTPQDIWIDALSEAGRNKIGESIYDGLARRYELEKQQQEVQKE